MENMDDSEPITFHLCRSDSWVIDSESVTQSQTHSVSDSVTVTVSDSLIWCDWVNGWFSTSTSQTKAQKFRLRVS